MTKPPMMVNPYRNRKLVVMPKPKFDWTPLVFWAFIIVFGTVEGGSAIFGFRAFVMWLVSRLEGLIR